MIWIKKGNVTTVLQLNEYFFKQVSFHLGTSILN